MLRGVAVKPGGTKPATLTLILADLNTSATLSPFLLPPVLSATHRYDHHQREFQEVFGHGFSTRLSSAGLVYKHFGRGIVAAYLNEPEESAQVEAVWLAVYRTFMEAIDAVDNGVNQWDGDAPPKYVNDTHLSARVGRLNPDWNAADQSEAELYRRFLQAVELAGSEFDGALRRTAQIWLPARQLVLADLSSRKDVDPSGAVVALSTFCPWKEHLHQLEQELGCPGEVLYVLYQDEREGSWRVQAVGQAPGSFASRKALPAPWRGLRDEALSEAAGVPDLVFVHASGFIGGGKTKEAALALARKAVAA